jgi:hypothetical protein
MISRSFGDKIKFGERINGIRIGFYPLINFQNKELRTPLKKINKYFHNTFAINNKNSNIFSNINKRFFSSKLNFKRQFPEKKEVRRDKEFINERLKANMIKVVNERYDILGTHSSLTSFFDLSSHHDIVLNLKNTKHLKIYGANNIFFNNSKYVLFEIDEKLNLNLILAEDLFFSKAELFNLFSKVLGDLELETLYSEKELIDYFDYSYTKTSTLNDVYEFFVKTAENYQEENKIN